MAAAKKVKYVHEDDSMPPIPRAAHLAMLILAATGCNTWKTLVETPDAQTRVRITPEQQQLINEYGYVIQYVQRSPMRTINYCPVCGRWAIVQKNPPVKQSGCKLSISCTGTLVRVGKTAVKKEIAE